MPRPGFDWPKRFLLLRPVLADPFGLDLSNECFQLLKQMKLGNIKTVAPNFFEASSGDTNTINTETNEKDYQGYKKTPAAAFSL